MGKTPKGDGYPRKRPDGTWVQWVDLGYRDGKRLRKKVESKDRDTVKRRVAELRRLNAAGADVTKRASTVKELLERYLESHDGKPRTLIAYRYIVDDFLIPHIGTIQADKLTGRQVRDLFITLRNTPCRPRGRQTKREQGESAQDAPTLSTKTLSLIRTVLHGAYAMAMAEADGLIVRNPVTGIKAPKAPRRPRRAKALDPAKVGTLLTQIQGHRLELGIKLALLGLRRSEVVGLRLQDIDMTTGELTITGQLSYLSGVGLQWAETKAEDSVRTLLLPKIVQAELRFFLQRRAAEQKALGWPDSPYLFRSIKHGGPLNGDRVYAAFKEAMQAIGLDGYRLHDLRHTYISYLADQGLSPAAIQALAGHANIEETLNYMHPLPGHADQAAETMDRLFRQAAGEK